MKGMGSLFLSCTSSSSLSHTMSLHPMLCGLHTILDFEGHIEMLIDVISAEENGVVTTCELTTYEPDEDEETNEIV